MASPRPAPASAAPPAYEPAETAAIRERERAAAAALIGAEFRCARLPDLAVFNDDEARRRVTEIVRWARPDIVLTAAPADYHPDHEATSLLVRDACFAAPVPNYRTGPAAARRPSPTSTSWTRWAAGTGTAPASSRPSPSTSAPSSPPSGGCSKRTPARWSGWPSSTPSPTSPAPWRRGRATRAGAFGVEAAEGFRQYRHHPYPTTALLQELVGEAL